MQRESVVCSKSVGFIESGAHCLSAAGEDRAVGTMRNEGDRIFI